MAQTRRGCGCVLAALAALLVVAGLIFWQFMLPKLRESWIALPPPASGAELRVAVLDVGQGDAILIVSPTGKVALVDAGVPGSGKKILDAMKRHSVAQIDLLIATHAHADHIGGADEVIKATTVRAVLDSKVPNTTKNYQDFLTAIADQGVEYMAAEPDQTFDLGGGAVIRVLAPVPPFFTKEQLRAGGNEPNANSIVARLDYGSGFSMLLTGDAEAQTEERLLRKSANVRAKILKVGHHGSKYASSEEFLDEGEFEAAIISASVNNRYGHPSQDVLDRLRTRNIKLYRTDLQGEITITTRGEGYEIKTARQAEEEMWAGRKAQKDDSARSGFVAYGDFGPAPKPKKEPAAQKQSAGSR